MSITRSLIEAFRKAREVIDDVTEGMGTLVRVEIPGQVTAVDPETLAATSSPPTVLARDVPAIVVAGAGGAQADIFPAATPTQDTPWTITLGREVTYLRKGCHVVVTQSEDPGLAGRRFEVTTVLANSAGVVRQCTAKAVPTGGHT